jgi:hypothetical protein
LLVAALKLISSLRLTILCILFLIFLIIAGTLYQTSFGLYQAQEKFFNSYVFFLGDFFPVPSVLTILWVLFFNLLASLIYRFEYTWKKLPLLFTHFALLLFLISAFINFYFSEESTITLKEGERSNYSENLEKKRFELAFAIELEDVSRELYDGTEIPKAYSSKIKIYRKGLDSVLNYRISMNNPFRYKEYSFYQANYGIDESGIEFTVLAVVKNYAPWLAYLSSLLVSLFLFIYFIFMLLRHYGKRA